MTSSKNLMLIYFKMRALADPPQLLLNYADIPYRYQINWEYFDKPWNEVKPNIPFGQLPLLIAQNGGQIAQSGSIVRYIANKANMVPSDSNLAAMIDSIFETAHEMFFPLNPTVNFAVGAAYEEAKKSIIDNVKSRLTNFEDILNNTLGGSFFLGEKPYYCDFGVYHHLSLLRLLEPKIFDKYPSLNQFMNAIESIESIAKYLKLRPDLIGVGTKPQLVIDGKACNTGVTIDP